MSKLKIAVSQFPVSENIKENEAYISKHIWIAHKRGADIIHFPETSLSGYDTEIGKLDWSLLDESLDYVRDIARRCKINVVLGLHQKRKPTGHPFNSTYLISNIGRVTGVYSKTNLYKKENNRFSSKKNFLVKKINGVKCGFLICYDSCFPKLFQHYRNQGVKILFLSYYNARSFHGKSSLDDLMEAQLKTRAADNRMYISASNSCARYSRMPSGIASPDGKVVKLKRHKTGVLIYDYPQKSLGWTYDSSNV